MAERKSKDSSSAKTTRIGVISLGCAKNLVDTEVMLGHLDRAGCAFVERHDDADVILVNTCSFIGPAREESIQTILEAAELKKSGKLRRLVVAGCMVQRYAEELRDNLPEVDAFIGLDELHKVVEGAVGENRVTAERSDRSATDRSSAASSAVERPAVERPAESELPVLQIADAPPTGPTATASWDRATYLYSDATPRKLSTSPWTAYVKIAEGCDHTCSFCAIPSFRGLFRSREVDSIVREAESLARGGVREVNLIAQDSSHFGRDRGRREGLSELLVGLDGIEALRWIRVHYLYPNTVTPRLVETMARLPRVANYVDIPLQHAHPETLRRMRRGGSGDSHLELLGRFRAAMPDVALRSTFIVGFPGETEQEFAALMDFVAAVRFDHLGVFTYSHEDRTRAFELDDDVPEAVKQERHDRLMELQQRIVLERNESQVGRRVEVLCEGLHADTELLLVGRTAGQAPDVDGQILINDGNASAGEFVEVELTETAGYDLVGRIASAA